MVEIAPAAKSGDRVKTLEQLRDRLAADLDVCVSARDVAALSQRLMDVLEQIDVARKSAPQAKGTPRDEVARKRAERTPAAAQRRA